MKLYELKKVNLTILLFCINFMTNFSHATAINDPKINAWINEAILATYTFDAANVLERQKMIAKYFTADGWMNYGKALKDSKLIATVQANKYTVAALPLAAPKVTIDANNKWSATMPIIVTYHGKDSSQTQALQIKILFVATPAGQGMAGKAIERLWALPTEQPCPCEKTQKNHDAT